MSQVGGDSTRPSTLTGTFSTCHSHRPKSEPSLVHETSSTLTASDQHQHSAWTTPPAECCTSMSRLLRHCLHSFVTNERLSHPAGMLESCVCKLQQYCGHCLIPGHQEPGDVQRRGLDSACVHAQRFIACTQQQTAEHVPQKADFSVETDYCGHLDFVKTNDDTRIKHTWSSST